MKLKFVFICCAAFLYACANPSADDLAVERETPDPAGDLAVFANDHAALEIPELALSYVDNLANLGELETLQRQREVLLRWREALRLADSSALGLCERIDLAKAHLLIDRGVERAELGLRFLDADIGDISTEGLSAVPLGGEWYAHFLKSWLGADVTPDEIFAFGEAQIELALAQRRKIQAAIGFENDDAGLAAHLASSEFIIPEGAQIEEGFRQAQKKIRDNIKAQFVDDYGVPLALIKKSNSEQMAAVPGYYDGGAQTFFYNVLGGEYDLRERDWLFLHEATPGHHFQIWIHGHKSKCESALPEVRLSSFLEGWAAYVETIGAEMGLYAMPEYELAAIDWNLVRSVRVALDVGLNAYGWTDEEALAYWQKSIQGKDDIGRREIARMRRWPAQVVTYKYGADVFLRAKAAMAASEGEEFDVRRYHDLALSYGAMPFEVFESLARNPKAAR